MLGSFFQPWLPAQVGSQATSHILFHQELAFIEFFAGDNAVWKAVRADGIQAAKIDIAYFENLAGGQNPLDINTNAGLGFLISLNEMHN